MKQEFETMLILGSKAILEMAGVFNEPGPGRKPAGFSRIGQQVFVVSAMADSADTELGAQFAHSYAAVVSPFGVLKKKEFEYLAYLAAASKTPKLFQVLDRLYGEKKGDTFSATLLKAVKTGTRHALGVVAAVKIYNNWGVMSPAMKSVAIVMLGGQTYLIEPGKALCDLLIINGPNQVLTVGDVLTLFARGKNPYGLVANWNQLRNLTRVYNDNPTVSAVIDFAQSHMLLSKSPNDSAVPGVTKTALTSAGAKPAPQYGVGALSAPKDSPVPPGYTHAIDTQDAKLVVPTANGKSALGALQGSLLGSKSGDNGLSINALGVYKNWNSDEKYAEEKGAEGGSALLAGLTRLKDQDAFLYGAMVAFFTHYVEGQIRSSTPNEYFASLAGIALARLIAGKKDYTTDKEGTKITQTMQSTNPGDFAKLQVDLRALYASFRVSSRADAYQLSNQGYAEERFNESDLTAMHEIFDIVYGENGLAAAEKLMNGKDRGLEIAKDKSKPPMNTMLEHKFNVHRKVLETINSENNKRKNAIRYAKKANAAQEEQDAAPTQEAPQDTGAPPSETSSSAPPETDAGPTDQNAPQVGANG